MSRDESDHRYILSLIPKIQRGDEQAIEVLVLHARATLEVLTQLKMTAAVRARFSADEISQVVWEEILRTIQSSPPTKNFYAWAATIIHRTILRMGRGRRDEVRDPGGAGDSSSFGAAAAIHSPSEGAYKKERVDQLVDAIQSLSHEQRTVLELRSLQQIDWEGIAERIDKSVAATRQIHLRARRELARILPQDPDSLPDGWREAGW